MKIIKKYSFGIILSVIVALISIKLSSLISNDLISPSVFALIIGMMINPYLKDHKIFKKGIIFSSKTILKLAIIFMGASLSFKQVVSVGKISAIVMIFTLFTAFIGGYFIGKLFKMDWKLSSLISAGTGICGGSAVAAIAPVIKAKTTDIAYAISATFIFDVIMVIVFPIMGRYFNMSDLGFGLWSETAINDTSSVVAAGYAFSDIAGNYSIIVKLTRTLSIVPIVLIFSYISQKVENNQHKKVEIKNIFPYFILMFLLVVLLNSLNLIPSKLITFLSAFSKFSMVVALGAIGLNTNFKEVSKSGFLPMFFGFLISLLVVIVAFVVQLALGQL